MRLPNQLIPPLLMLLPAWGRAGVMSLILVLMLEGGRRAMRLSLGSGLTYVWLAVAILMLPWYDMMMSVSLFMNYVLPSALMLWLLNFLVNKRLSALPLPGYIGVLALAFLFGWSHEGFSVPMAVFIAVAGICKLMREGRLDRRLVGVLLALCLGILIIALSPILPVRIALPNKERPLWELMISLGPALCFIALFVICAMRALRRDHALLAVMLATCSACMAELVIALNFNYGPRTFWPASLYAIFGTFLAIQALHKAYWEKPRPYFAALAVSMAAIVANLLAAILAQPRYTAEMQRVVKLYQNCDNPYGEIYIDVTPPRLDFSLLKTTARVLNEHHSLLFMSWYYNYGSRISILPEKLQSFTGRDMGRDSVIVMGNSVIIRPRSVTPYRDRAARLTLITPSGEISSRYRTDTFHKDSVEYVILTPHATTLNPSLEVLGARIDL